jgi:hypothetical protein
MILIAPHVAGSRNDDPRRPRSDVVVVAHTVRKGANTSGQLRCEDADRHGSRVARVSEERSSQTLVRTLAGDAIAAD